MSNMGYARFRNTLPDLRDCFDNWDDADSEDERRAQKALLKLCLKIVKNFCDDDISNAIFHKEQS